MQSEKNRDLSNEPSYFNPSSTMMMTIIVVLLMITVVLMYMGSLYIVHEEKKTVKDLKAQNSDLTKECKRLLEVTLRNKFCDLIHSNARVSTELHQLKENDKSMKDRMKIVSQHLFIINQVLSNIGQNEVIVVS